MSKPPLEGNSTDANVPGVKGTFTTSALAVGGAGVLGEGQGTGVHGVAHGVASTGVFAESDGPSPVVWAPDRLLQSVSFGVRGSAGEGVGIFGLSSGKNAAVVGYASGTVQDVAGVYEISKSGNGVYGTAGDGMTGTMGENSGGGSGVYGKSVSGNGVVGYSKSGNAGQFNGPVYVDGTLTVKVDIVLAGADCAEEFDIDASTEVKPGMVMVLCENEIMQPCLTAYDKKVAGVISGAGEYRPALILDRGSSTQLRKPVALIGKVYCMADANFGAIEVGDLLTTSSTVGHAMLANDPALAFGAVLGKALRSLKSGRGMIPILVALQ